MSVLVDTNILLRRTQPDHPNHAVAVESVATRPIEKNGLGFSVALVLREVEKIEWLLTFLPDSPAIYGEWKRLVVEHSVLGVKVHDAKLVGAMNVHGIPKILTFNTDDFARYGVEAVHPHRYFLRAEGQPAAVAHSAASFGLSFDPFRVAGNRLRRLESHS